MNFNSNVHSGVSEIRSKPSERSGAFSALLLLQFAAASEVMYGNFRLFCTLRLLPIVMTGVIPSAYEDARFHFIKSI